MILPALLMLAQATGPMTSAPTMTPQMPTAPLPIPRRSGRSVPAPAVGRSPAPAPSAPLAQCLATAQRDADAALVTAQNWAMTTKGAPRAEAEHCRGVALGALGRWGEAEGAFTAAREAAVLPAFRARYGAMAGNAALAAGDLAKADSAFAAAYAAARSAADAQLAADIAIDRSRALVGLKREGEAAAALSEGRAASAGNATGWLLSATLARRQGNLAQAQQWIERAATLNPVDPAIGLEAGAIAVLAGRDEAARKSWRTVISLAPGSGEAASAKRYLDQLGTVAPSPGK